MGTEGAPPPAAAPTASNANARKTVSERWVDGKLHVGNYEIVGKLGEGTFGTVLKGVHVHVGETVAIKVLEKSRINTADEIERVGREVQILKSVQHANVVRLWELLYTRDKIYLVMEFSAQGELFGQIVKKGRLKDEEARFYFQQAVEGLDYLHGIEVVHRDIKPENLLVDHTRRIKIVDFGLSARCAHGGYLKTACGSPCYAAPEMLTRETRQGYEGHPVDVWSLGVTLYAMLCGYLPFEHAQTALLYKKIIAGEYKAPAFLSADAKDLLRRMLCTDPKRRFTLDQIRKHPWVWRSATGAKVAGAPALAHSATLNALHEGSQSAEVDGGVLDALAAHGYDRDAVAAAVRARKHDEHAGAYWLALVRKAHVRLAHNQPAAAKESGLHGKENQYPAAAAAASGAQTHRPGTIPTKPTHAQPAPTYRAVGRAPGGGAATARAAGAPPSAGGALSARDGAKQAVPAGGGGERPSIFKPAAGAAQAAVRQHQTGAAAAAAAASPRAAAPVARADSGGRSPPPAYAGVAAASSPRGGLPSYVPSTSPRAAPPPPRPPMPPPTYEHAQGSIARHGGAAPPPAPPPPPPGMRATAEPSATSALAARSRRYGVAKEAVSTAAYGVPQPPSAGQPRGRVPPPAAAAVAARMGMSTAANQTGRPGTLLIGSTAAVRRRNSREDVDVHGARTARGLPVSYAVPSAVGAHRSARPVALSAR
jgi:hypothetical protein